MSVSEAERFANDLVSNLPLRNTVKAGASGLASVVDIANKNGYSFTIDDAKQYMQSQSPHQLTDAQLDAVAGGKSSTSSTTVQTTAVATSAAEAAEVATSAVQVAEAAADAAVAAEVVAVVAAVLT
ncbi:MAG TPA: Nif11-like leader peptide family natural product precursor [Geminicoccus sp.]|jgi:predicted ribosomally synthesized peptide with nif11-like leader|uniref:Nif11-like leader peptide family natural product precursor n=1 Tax=Geminicoccus sp. TaxID=2024832 RepID=UPI002E3137D6|nr:Nif11-like leader peptide family natural product precursor [Geminicoccus sp.]HEX2526083.1 Nif11-like leader peptide family natural product precursor [Geminicoccus sp.]